MTLQAERPLAALVVDDNATNRLVLARTVETLGGSVTLAENGFQAVELGAAKAFDIVFMDIAMPGMDGMEATRRLRDAGCAAPIVAVSCYATAKDLRPLMDAGFNHLIEKPFGLQPVADALTFARQLSSEGHKR
jgi:CheY-like chemotaxis protein